MTEAVIRAVYHDYKRVPSRKVFQIICEIPIEQAPMVHQAFGEPSPSDSMWVFIAKADPALVADEKQKDHIPKSHAQMAGILCNDPMFQKFMREMYPDLNDKLVADLVREHCLVESRAEFDTDTGAGDRWYGLKGAFQAWKHAPGCGG